MDINQLIKTGAIEPPPRVPTLADRARAARTTWCLWRRSGASLRFAFKAARRSWGGL